MERSDTSITSAEALVALAVQGRVGEQVSQHILQAVSESKAGSRAFQRTLPPSTRAAPYRPPAREPEYLHPLGLLQDDLAGEYLEIAVSLHGERVLLRGYVISDTHEFTAWLAVRPGYYADPERPALLRALAGMALLKIPESLCHDLMHRYPGSVLLSAVRRTYARRQELRHPPGYLAWLLNTTQAAPTVHAI